MLNFSAISVVQDIQHYASLIFWHTVYLSVTATPNRQPWYSRQYKLTCQTKTWSDSRYLCVRGGGGRRSGLLKVDKHVRNAVAEVHLVVDCQRLVFLQLYVLRRQYQLSTHHTTPHTRTLLSKLNTCISLHFKTTAVVIFCSYSIRSI